MTGRLLHTIVDAAALLSVNPRTLERLISEGEVETVKLKRRRLVPHESLLAYIEKLKAAS